MNSISEGSFLFNRDLMSKFIRAIIKLNQTQDKLYLMVLKELNV